LNLNKNLPEVITWQQRLAGWLLHIFTASGAYIGLLALLAITQQKLLLALWLMGAAIVIDAVDGMIARQLCYLPPISLPKLMPKPWIISLKVFLVTGI
jgi:hypothetical protein